MKGPAEETVNTLQREGLSRSDLYAFSNLSRQEAKAAYAAVGALPVETRRRIARLMIDIAESDFAVNFGEVFRLALADEDAGVRRAAIEGLWEDEDSRLVPLLATLLLEDPATEVRAAAATSLGRFVLLGELRKIRERSHQQAFHALLAACTEQEEGEVRRRALESLAYSCEAVVAKLIREVYEDRNEQMRVSAVFAMGRNGDERWSSIVMRELYSPNPAMRYEAARACGELALEKSVPVLLELLEDVDVEVQEAVIWPLGQIGGDEARQRLVACTHMENEALRTAAQDALRELEFLHGDLGALLLFDLFDELDEGEEDEDLW